jgi:hypothetical protein
VEFVKGLQGGNWKPGKEIRCGFGVKRVLKGNVLRSLCIILTMCISSWTPSPCKSVLKSKFYQRFIDIVSIREFVYFTIANVPRVTRKPNLKYMALLWVACKCTIRRCWIVDERFCRLIFWNDFFN